MPMRLTRRAAIAGAAAAIAAVGLTFPAQAATVTLIVPFPAGGAVDILGRLVAERLQAKLGETVIVDNRGGAGGMIGTAAVAKAEPDGATLGVASTSQLIANKYLYGSSPYDPDADLVPISRVATGTVLCVANAKIAQERGWTTFRDLIAWSKAHPDETRMGSSGLGQVSHLMIELVKARTGAKILHVPYKGGGPAILDLLGGTIDMMFDVIPALMPHVKEKAFLPLAVGSRERIPALPDTPSMKDFSDLNLADVDLQTWYAVIAPKGYPADKQAALSKVLAEIMADPAVKARLEPIGFSPVTDASPDALKTRIAEENPMWKDMVRLSGAKLD
ncbi:tripartite tricarboxylate transporter substrate binding protein [Methylopila sp. 73B]|uniref:Bug family tripartite tricarboxylate transporter substrate binding protein n=1 Tax=Methylopila sp. 73B TaxID=1120792 RepID=UPI0003713752|nr:tripartite tricarboxylate transporter substrate binding protein [Methylopila sp. 73B]